MMIERGKKILSLRSQRMKRTTHLPAPLVAEQWNCSLNSLASNDAISRDTSAWFIKCIQPFSIKSIHTTFKIHTYIHLQEMPAALPYHLWRLHTETQACVPCVHYNNGRQAGCVNYTCGCHTHTHTPSVSSFGPTGSRTGVGLLTPVFAASYVLRPCCCSWDTLAATRLLRPQH